MRPALLAVALLSLVGLPATATAQEYLVIVNRENPSRTVSRTELSQMFLRRITTWSSGRPVVPVDLDAASPVREAFSRAIHGRPISAIRAYWQNQIFSGRGAPPDMKATEAEVIEFVRTNPGAVGYVRNGSALGTGVRTLRVVN